MYQVPRALPPTGKVLSKNSNSNTTTITIIISSNTNTATTTASDRLEEATQRASITTVREGAGGEAPLAAAAGATAITARGAGGREEAGQEEVEAEVAARAATGEMLLKTRKRFSQCDAT